MARDLGVPSINREDIVQDMYIKISDILSVRDLDITYGEEGVNKFYVYLTIRSLYGDVKRNKFYNRTESLDNLLTYDSDYTFKDALIYNETDNDEQTAFIGTYNKVMDVVSELTEHEDYPKYLKNKVPHFTNLFLGYNCTDKSMRQISDETGIRLGTIHKTLNKVMDIIRDEVGEDVADYFNKDYNLLWKNQKV